MTRRKSDKNPELQIIHPSCEQDFESCDSYELRKCQMLVWGDLSQARVVDSSCCRNLEKQNYKMAPGKTRAYLPGRFAAKCSHS